MVAHTHTHLYMMFVYVYTGTYICIVADICMYTYYICVQCVCMCICVYIKRIRPGVSPFIGYLAQSISSWNYTHTKSKLALSDSKLSLPFHFFLNSSVNKESACPSQSVSCFSQISLEWILLGTICLDCVWSKWRPVGKFPDRVWECLFYSFAGNLVWASLRHASFPSLPSNSAETVPP